MEAIANSGLGMKLDDANAVKFSLPDAHTDFVFAVAAEEFGVLFCLVIITLIATLVVRALRRAAALRSVFTQLAVCGLAAMIGLQSMINIAVNLRLMPAKGMTLPLISYGGSSLIATGLTIGLLLALTRRSEHAARRLDVMP
jgi:cell division protein FtsW